MRDPLAEPRTTPVTLRRRSEHVMTVHAFGLDIAARDALFTRVADAAHALDEPVTCYGGPAFDTPPTPRDLIRAARAAGRMPRRDRDAEYGDRRFWQHTSVDETSFIRVAHDPHRGWSMSFLGANTNCLWLHEPSAEQIAAAAALCGWDLGSTT